MQRIRKCSGNMVMHAPGELLWSEATVDAPLLAPGRFVRRARRTSDHVEPFDRTERGERVLVVNLADVGIRGIERRAHLQQNRQGVVPGLQRWVGVHPSRYVAEVAYVAEGRVVGPV